MSATKNEVSYVISVTVATGCYRHIQISSKATLFQLHETIIDAFEFFDDHAHAFFMDNVAWSDRSAYYSDVIEDEEAYTKDYRLEDLDFAVNMKFKYIFDFGDEWVFQCRILKILEEKTEEPKMVRSKGEAPSQYACADDFEDEELDEDE